jgi:bacteriochlorophyllide a dehydrogenase
VLDSLQSEALQQEYLPLLQHGLGQIVYCGFSPEKTWADMALLQKAELTAHFVSGWNRPRLEATLALLQQGALRIKPLITHLVPYFKGPAMYELICNKPEPFLGITLDWRECP